MVTLFLGIFDRLVVPLQTTNFEFGGLGQIFGLLVLICVGSFLFQPKNMPWVQILGMRVYFANTGILAGA